MKLILCSLLFTACIGVHPKHEDVEVKNKPNFSELEPSFNNIYKFILKPKCIQCHDGVGDKSDIVLINYYDILNNNTESVPVVYPGQPDSSSLYFSVNTNDFRWSMPEKAEPLSVEEIQLIYDWIKLGANP